MLNLMIRFYTGPIALMARVFGVLVRVTDPYGVDTDSSFEIAGSAPPEKKKPDMDLHKFTPFHFFFSM